MSIGRTTEATDVSLACLVALGASAVLSALPAHADCYDLRANDGTILSSTEQPPFDMSWPPSPDYQASRSRGERLAVRKGACYSALELETRRLEKERASQRAARSQENPQHGETPVVVPEPPAARPRSTQPAVTVESLQNDWCRVGNAWYRKSDQMCAQKAGHPEPLTSSASPRYPARSQGSNPACQVGRDQARDDLKKTLLARYGNHYSTVEMLLEAGMRDYGELCATPSNAVDEEILSNLSSRYYPSFSTILMLYKRDRASYERLNR